MYLEVSPESVQFKSLQAQFYNEPELFCMTFLFIKNANPNNDVIVNVMLYKTERFDPKLFHNNPIIFY